MSNACYAGMRIGRTEETAVGGIWKSILKVGSVLFFRAE